MAAVWLEEVGGSSSPVTELLKVRMPLPREAPISGRRLAPKIKRIISRTISIWGNPIGPKPILPPCRGGELERLLAVAVFWFNDSR